MIAIASDHGGFLLKEHIKQYFAQNNIVLKDFGVDNPQSVDYPDMARLVCESILSGECEKGILICGTGIGISIAANKFTGIRAALCSDSYSAQMAAEHNNANILALGGRVIGPDLAIAIVTTWMKSHFQGGRHQTRVDKISQLEKY